MEIELQNLGKRFNRHWIFRKLSYTFSSGNAYAIVGPNGSGKSTLLQVIAGAAEKSEGEIRYNSAGPVPPEDHYKFVAIAAPYLELIEELTLVEFLRFHFSFKKVLDGHSIKDIIQFIGLEDAAQKQIRLFSSGMKQRVKLAQAVFSDAAVVMLDEPTSNLDLAGIELYEQLVLQFCADRLLIVCSNDEAEIKHCRFRLNITDFKPAPVI